MSHDWPFGVIDNGDKENLFRLKPYFKDEYQKGDIGCKEYKDLMERLQPKYWISGHMHVFFKATMKHSNSKETIFLAADKAQEDFRHFVDVFRYRNSVLTI